MSYPISSSLLDGIVLAVVERESTYGYRITQDVQKVLDISESTLYPVLRRLMKDGCLTTYDQAYAGRNRRYYQITEHGRGRLSTACACAVEHQFTSCFSLYEYSILALVHRRERVIATQQRRVHTN